MDKKFVKNVCKILGHAEGEQGPECGMICSRCEEYPEIDDPWQEAKLLARIFGSAYQPSVCKSCQQRVARLAVKKGIASWLSKPQ